LILPHSRTRLFQKPNALYLLSVLISQLKQHLHIFCFGLVVDNVSERKENCAFVWKYVTSCVSIFMSVVQLTNTPKIQKSCLFITSCVHHFSLCLLSCSKSLHRKLFMPCI
jgi:hypothetical protein